MALNYPYRPNIKELDSDFDLYLESLETEVSDSELTPDKKKKRRERADKDDFEFCRIYFPHIFTEEFNPAHEKIEELKKGQWLITGARKIGKTAFAYVTKCIKRIVLGNSGMIGLAMRTMEEGSKPRTAAIIRLIKKNKLLQYDYDINFQQDRAGHYIINSVTFIALSIDKVLRGMGDEDFSRFDVLILDDLFSSKTVTSEKDNETVYRFMTDEAPGQLNDDGLLIILANMTSHDSPAALYSKEYPDRHFSFPALINNEGEYDEEGETIWVKSKTHTREYWIEKKNSMPYDVWMGQYADSPILIGNEFQIEWLRTINIKTVEIVSSMSAADPAYGTSPNSCYKSLVTMGITNKNEYPVLDIYLRHEDYYSFFEYASHLREKYPAWKSLAFENDFEQWFNAEPYYIDWQKDSKQHLPIQPITTKELETVLYGTSKESRIRNLIFPFQKGQIPINIEIENWEDYKRWRTQYLGFGKLTTKLDGLDAMATCFILLPRLHNNGTFKPTKKRKFANQEDAWLNRPPIQ